MSDYTFIGGSLKVIKDFYEKCRGNETQRQFFTKPPELKLPDIKIGESSTLKERAEARRAWKKLGQDAKAWMLCTGLPARKEIEEYVDEFEDEALNEPYSEKDSRTVGQVKEEIDQQINEWARIENPLVYEQVELAELLFKLVQPRDYAGLCGLLKKLVSDEILKEKPEGLIKPFANQQFSLQPDCFQSIRQEAEQEIKEVLEGRAGQLKKQRFGEIQDKKQRIQDESELTVLEAWKAKEGLYAMEVDNGIIQVLVKDDCLEIVDASGRPEKGFSELKRLKEEYKIPVVVYWDDLKDEDGKLVPTTYRLKNIWIPDRVEANDRKAWFNAAVFAWWQIRPAFEAALSEVEAASQTDDPNRLRLRAKNSLSAREFHQLKKSGCYWIGHPEFSHFDNKVENPEILVKQWSEDGKTHIQIAEVLPEHEAFFAECMGTKFEVKEKFEGVRHPLGNFLKRDFAVRVVAANNGKRRNGSQ